MNPGNRSMKRLDFHAILIGHSNEWKIINDY